MAANDTTVYKVGNKRYVRFADGLVASCNGSEYNDYVAGGATPVDPQDEGRMGNIIKWSDLKKAAYAAAAG